MVCLGFLDAQKFETHPKGCDFKLLRISDIKMPNIIIKNNIRKIVKELDEQKIISSVAEEVEKALEEKVIEDLKKAIKRAKANQRRTLLARDL